MLVWSESSGVGQTGELVIAPPLTLSNRPPQPEFGPVLKVARQFDVAGRNARNRALGRAGEERVLFHERSTLTGAGRSDLAKFVRWMSKEEGDGAGYDIASFSPDGMAA